MKTKKEKWQEYYIINKIRLLKSHKLRRIENTDYYKKYEKDRYRSNPELYKEKWRKYCKENREKINAQRRLRYANDIDYKLKCVFRARLISSIKQDQKRGSILKYLGCSIPEFKEYIEKQFKKDMTWDNWTQNGWHIDHKIPLSHFDLKNEKEIIKACHYTNLQPMWSMENFKKGNRI